MKPTPHTARGFDNVYDPAEDSFFLLDCLEKDEKFIRRYTAPVVLELGTGTGIVSSFIPQLIDSNYVAMASDLNPAACKCAGESWKINWNSYKPQLDTIRGDLLSFMKPQSVDILVFNPPYVPSEKVPDRPGDDTSEDDDRWVDLALDGGENGMEVTNVLLDQLDRYLSSQGSAYILFISGNHPEKVSKDMEAKGWNTLHIDTRRAGREVLSVYRFSRKP